MAGWYIARRWALSPWRAAAWNAGFALDVAQVVEPALEELFYEHERYLVNGELQDAVRYGLLRRAP